MTHTRKTVAAALSAVAMVIALSACSTGGDSADETTPPASGDSNEQADGGEGDEAQAAADPHGAECIPAALPGDQSAADLLEAAGVTVPVELNLQYSLEHYGDSSAEEYAAIKAQLEETGLFAVNLQTTEWVQYSADRSSDAYPLYQLGWFPDFPDADNYLTPFFDTNNFLNNHYDDKCTVDLLNAERVETDPAVRAGLIEDLQTELASKLSTLPLLQGRQVAIVRNGVTGVQDTLDASFQFRFSTFQKDSDPTATVTAGSTDVITSLDPAFAYDNASYLAMINVYPFVLGFQQGSAEPQPDLAESCEFSDDGMDYTCTLKSGLKWANGHDLTSSDVKFSFDRQVDINYVNGPASLLANLDSVETPDDTTVIFHLTSANDVTFSQVLASPVGPIVDEEVFTVDPQAPTPDQDIVAGNAFAGAYTVAAYREGELLEFATNPDYAGVQGTPVNGGITYKFYADGNNMKLEVEDGTIDIAWRQLTPTDIESLEANSDVEVQYGPGGEIRYIVFNLDTQPGDTYDQKLAIRQAVAMSIDRQAISEQVFKGTYTPLCSFVPDGLPGANTAVCDAYNVTAG